MMSTRRRINGHSGKKLIEPSPKAGQGQRKVILVPFEALDLSTREFEPAIDMAKTTSAELVLLCVRRLSKPARDADEEEHLFSDLRALQAQLQNRDASARIETVVGPVAQFVQEYADRHEAEVIILPQAGASGAAGRRLIPYH